MFIRDVSGDWDVSVHHSLDDILSAWDSATVDPIAGVLHVGFERRNAKSFDQLAQKYSNQLLLTPGARGALPASYVSSKMPVGEAGEEPIFLALDGWGYTSEEPSHISTAEVPAQPIAKQAIPMGWVRSFFDEQPDLREALISRNITDDQSYLSKEINLPTDIRRLLGKYRFNYLLGAEQNDPTEMARSAPPWLIHQKCEELGLTVRLRNAFRLNGIETVADLGCRSSEDLLSLRNFGKTSIVDLCQAVQTAVERGPREKVSAAWRDDEETEQLSAASTVDGKTLIEEIEISLEVLPDRQTEILKRRMGWNSGPQTLEEIGSDYGVTRERIRQLESQAFKSMLRHRRWHERLSITLGELLSDRRYPLPLVGVAALDPWLEGFSERSSLVRYLLGKLSDIQVSVLEIDGIEYVSNLTEMQWQEAQRVAVNLLQAAAEEKKTKADCRNQINLLLPDNSSEYRELLWNSCARFCHFAAKDDDEILVSFGRGVDQLVEAIMHEAMQPLHYSEIYRIAQTRSERTIDERRVHNAAAQVGYLFGSGQYGTLKHLSVERQLCASIAQEVSDVILESGASRQWHTSELLRALAERDFELPADFDKYQLDIALKQTGGLQSLGRMVWSSVEGAGADNRVDVRQAIISIIKQAGKPISDSDLRQRLIAVRGINDGMQIHIVDPLIKLDTRTWGLNDRDLELKRPQQKLLLDKTVETLEQHKEPMLISSIMALSPQPIPPRALRCLLVGDNRLSLNPSGAVSLNFK